MPDFKNYKQMIGYERLDTHTLEQLNYVTTMAMDGRNQKYEDQETVQKTKYVQIGYQEIEALTQRNE